VTGRRDFELYGSGRTDAGVHALAQIAHLDVATNLPPDTLVTRMNDQLPHDINLLSASVVPHRFHARHDAVGRRYLYQIATRRTAFAKSFVWWVRERLDIERMRQAGQAFVGMRDFRSFAASNVSASRTRPDKEPEDDGDGSEPSTRVLIDRMEIGDAGDLVLIGIEGSHFLWRMVRRLVGVLAAVGRGELDAATVAAFLSSPSEVPARLTAPAAGLFLECVYYKGDPRQQQLTPAVPVSVLATPRSSRVSIRHRTVRPIPAPLLLHNSPGRPRLG
jgi:tRNA pseudouridine38-40 synthase